MVFTADDLEGWHQRMNAVLYSQNKLLNFESVSYELVLDYDLNLITVDYFVITSEFYRSLIELHNSPLIYLKGS
jgi:hypothetical protein